MNNPQVTEYITSAPEEQAHIMHTLRALIHESVPGVEEHCKWSRPVFGLEKDFTYLKSAKKHITLGFMNYESIPDSQNILEGTGKDMRHIKIKTSEDINSEQLKTWFRAAAGLK